MVLKKNPLSITPGGTVSIYYPEYWESGIIRFITDEGIEGIAVAPRAAITVDLVQKYFDIPYVV
jgi:hypothetical protein